MTITTAGYNGFNMTSAEELVPWFFLTVLSSKALSIMKLPKQGSLSEVVNQRKIMSLFIIWQ